MSKPHTRVFDMMVFNECYLDNAGDYQRIAVLDMDETIMPHVSHTSLEGYYNETVTRGNQSTSSNRTQFISTKQQENKSLSLFEVSK